MHTYFFTTSRSVAFRSLQDLYVSTSFMDAQRVSEILLEVSFELRTEMNVTDRIDGRTIIATINYYERLIAVLE